MARGYERQRRRKERKKKDRKSGTGSGRPTRASGTTDTRRAAPGACGRRRRAAGAVAAAHAARAAYFKVHSEVRALDCSMQRRRVARARGARQAAARAARERGRRASRPLCAPRDGKSMATCWPGGVVCAHGCASQGAHGVALRRRRRRRAAGARQLAPGRLGRRHRRRHRGGGRRLRGCSPGARLAPPRSTTLAVAGAVPGARGGAACARRARPRALAWPLCSTALFGCLLCAAPCRGTARLTPPAPPQPSREDTGAGAGAAAAAPSAPAYAPGRGEPYARPGVTTLTAAPGAPAFDPSRVRGRRGNARGGGVVRCQARPAGSLLEVCFRLLWDSGRDLAAANAALRFHRRRLTRPRRSARQVVACTAVLEPNVAQKKYNYRYRRAPTRRE